VNVRDAGDLLDVMRPEISSILRNLTVYMGDDMPTCTSQSLRARRAVEWLDERMKESKLGMGQWFELNRHRSRLKDFLAVHRTVTMLERMHANTADFSNPERDWMLMSG